MLRDDDKNTDQVKVLQVVKQGFVLSPILFNVYSEELFRETLDNLTVGIQ